MAATLFLKLAEDGRQVEARRDDEVGDGFWLTLRGNWGSVGPKPSRAVLVPVEMFLARLGWLTPACRIHRVALDWDDALVQLVRNSQADRRALSTSMQGVVPLDEGAVRARLDGSRFSRELRDFQLRDLGHLLALQHGANFSVPGAGKTAVQYAAYEAEHHSGRVEQMLVVAPLSAFESWRDEAQVCFSQPPIVQRFDGGTVPAATEVLLVNYQRLINDYEKIARWASSGATLIVLDEAHRMKRGWSGEWGAACLKLAYLGRRRDILSGTPAPQHTRDMEALIDFVWPSQARSVLPADALRTIPPANAGHQVAQAIAPLFVRTTKRELRLDDPVKTVIPVDMSPLHAQIYDALRSQYAGRYKLGVQDRVWLADMGDVTMYLLEAATNPALLVAGSSDDDPIEFRHPPLDIPADSTLATLLTEYAAYETPEKFIPLLALLDANAKAGRKTLVWTNFVRNLETLQRMLGDLQPAMVHGRVPSEISQPNAPVLREAEIARFREDDACSVLIANPAAMSEGISLHDVCHDAIYLDRTFNAGQFLQSIDRIHRLGLAPGTETRITFLVSRGTIDELVNDRVEKKATTLGHILDDPDIVTMALPDDEDYGAPVDVGDVDEVAALFAHLRGDGVDH